MSKKKPDTEPNAVSPKPITLDHGAPRPYQRKAVNQILKTLEQHERTHIVMACGTGKTRVSLWVAEELSAKNIVVFLPSLALVNQFMHEWLKVTKWSRVSCLAVCSDETVTRGLDNIVLDPEDCDFPVTTDPHTIHFFLKSPTTDTRVVFCTYQSSSALSEGMQECPPFELGIFDEAHKTAGNNSFSLALDNEAIPIQKRLFMTATPKHYNIRKKNQESDAPLAYSMDSEELYGPRAYTLSFRAAINLGIITDYKIMISIVHSEDAKKSELDAKTIALKKAILKSSHIAKVITFHRTIKEAYHFSEHMQHSQAIPYFTNLHVSGLIPSHTRKEIMHAFQKSHKSIISNARCLTEGIDIPAIDMVAFLNTKKSKIDIVQAIGRAMRKVPGKTCGYVFLPLFVEQNKGESIEDAILRADYEDIWEVVQALSEQDEDLQVTIETLQQEKGKHGALTLGLEQYIEMITSDTVNVALQTRLQKIIFVTIIDKIGSSWNEMYGRLCSFKEKNHHCNVPVKYENKSLRLWVWTQRGLYNKQKLSEARINLLNAIGFDWDPLNTIWKAAYEALKQFKEIHNHCNFPQSYTNKYLRSWVLKQRQFYSKQKLSEARINLLNAIGFDWDPLNTIWEAAYEALKEFKEIHNHCNVPQSYTNKSLGTWVGTQRGLYNKQKLSEAKIKLLNAIGFDWDPLNTSWQASYEALKKFKAIHNHSNVSRYEDKSLGEWVSTQRGLYNKQKLSEAKIKQMNAIGFDWEPLNTSWQTSYEALKQFKAIHNHSNVPRFYKDTSLGIWVNIQRQFYRKQKLSQAKIKLLNAIGFDWEPLNTSWQTSYEALKQFKAIYNHSNVPQTYKDKSLGGWVSKQRQLYSKQKLSEAKIKLLNAIGFDWDPANTIWQASYKALKQFKSIHNHCNVSKRYKDKSLRLWVLTQRGLYNKQKLSEAKIKLLNAIGFDWDPFDTIWQASYEALKQFKSIHNHCNVSKRYKDKSLRLWVLTQRGLYNKQKLSEAKIKLLNAIGLDWYPFDTSWQASYEALKQFKAIHNHCKVPIRYKDKWLGLWVSNQRGLYNKQKLSEAKIKQMNAIGFDWEPLNTSWQASYEALKQFKAIHHHCNVSKRYKDKSLGEWVLTQRRLYKQKKLANNRIILLDNLGFQWSIKNVTAHPPKE